MNPETLGNLYRHHGGKASDKWELYLEIYERLFAEYRERAVRLLEIGVQNGGSLEIWAEYFSRATKLVGCDINPDCGHLVYDDPRISVVVGDANSGRVREHILSLVPRFDIFIDDGSHRSGDIVRSFANYFPALRDDGVFVVEDLHCSYWVEFDGGLYDSGSAVAFFKQLADVVNFEHWGLDAPRSSVFRVFGERYGISLEEEVLSHVHSIEFFNSVCVVRKKGVVHNVLGGRVIGGNEERVIAGHFPLRGTKSEPPRQPSAEVGLQSADEHRGPRSMGDDGGVAAAGMEEANGDVRRDTVDWEGRVASLTTALAKREEELAAVHASTSWRVTAPLRWLREMLRPSPRDSGMGTASSSREGPDDRDQMVQVDQHAGASKAIVVEEYPRWIECFDTPAPEDWNATVMVARNMRDAPLISVLMPTYNTAEPWLRGAIESVLAQCYTRWELCIADDASTEPHVRAVLEEYAKRDARIRLAYRNENGHISVASNTALALATGEFVALLDHDDVLVEDALYLVARELMAHLETDVVYSDEDKIDANGNRYDPHFKPDFNLELFYSQNFVCHLSALRRSLVTSLGGFREGFEGSQDYDLLLRCLARCGPSRIRHIPHVLYHWRAVPGSTALSLDEKRYAADAAVRALTDYFWERGDRVSVSHVGQTIYRIRFPLPSPLPMVSIVIHAAAGADRLRACVSSVLDRTVYDPYEIVIAGAASGDFELSACLGELADLPHCRVIECEPSLNCSAAHNVAARHARGDFLVLLDSRAEVISEEWLRELVMWGSRDGIGTVGCRLRYPEGASRSAGVLLGSPWVGSYEMPFDSSSSLGYFGRMATVHEVGANSARCLLVRRRDYLDVGGLDADTFPGAMNDVDLCLKLRQLGRRNVWTPHVEVCQHDSDREDTRRGPGGRDRPGGACAALRRRWGELLLADPAYNPNLTTEREAFSLAWPPRVGRFEGSAPKGCGVERASR